MHTAQLRHRLSLAALVAAIALGGCGSDDSPEGTPATDSGSSVSTAPPAGDSEVAPEPASSVELPSTYPSSDVPLIPGELTSASEIPGLGGWNVVLVPDSPLDAVVDEAAALLEPLGFEVVGTSGDNRNYSNDTYSIFVNLEPADGTVSYTVLGA